MKNQPINLNVLAEYFSEDYTIDTFLHLLHKAMTDYILAAGRYEGHGDIETVSGNIEFLGHLYDTILLASNKKND